MEPNFCCIHKTLTFPAKNKLMYGHIRPLTHICIGFLYTSTPLAIKIQKPQTRTLKKTKLRRKILFFKLCLYIISTAVEIRCFVLTFYKCILRLECIKTPSCPVHDVIFTDGVNTKTLRITSDFWVKHLRPHFSDAAGATAKFIPVSEKPRSALKLKSSRP